ncbi:MAG: ACT domain-containing protein [Planctomycetes bacterium]|nr:ACT domain-containing protein [Planctomycetota bacterium]
MAYSIKAVEAYATDLMNRPGMLARVLEALTNAGANLEFVIARRVSQNTSRVFLAPLKGAKVLRAAKDVGLQKAEGMHALRIEGPDRPGLGAHLTRGLASAGLNIRGLSAASISRRNVCYIAFATATEMGQAQKILKKLLSKK